MTFRDTLRNIQAQTRSLLCCGLDPDAERLPAGLPGTGNEAVPEFLKAVVAATTGLVCAYKPNLAFFEALGDCGTACLRDTLRAVPEGILTIADGKRGDIGNSARMYARALFEDLGFSAATVNPYMGEDAVRPFLEYGDRGVFVLCLTSNPGSADFQRENDLYLRVAEKVLQWDESGNAGLVVGAQHPQELARIRALVGNMPILVPGVGAQGGDLRDVLKAGIAENRSGLLINVSRSILYASDGLEFASSAREAAGTLSNTIREVLF